MRIVVIAMTLLLSACGQAAGEPAAAVASDGTLRVEEPVQIDEPLLGGVMPEGRCRLAEVVGAPDDPDADDAALGSMIDSTLELGVDRGPLVVVDVLGEPGAAVVAATVFGPDGQGFDAAAWTVRAGDATQVTAANQNAADGSSHPLAFVETAGEDEVAYALAFATDCSTAAADPFRPPAPPEPEPSIQPELMVVEPAVARPGTTVALRFPKQTGRGVAFNLDRAVDGGWQTVAWMTSDGNGGEPRTVPSGTDGYGTDDVGVGGRGPDRVALLDDLAPGSYRICTANAGDDFCAALEITR